MKKYILRDKVLDMLDNSQIITDGEICGYCTEDINILGIPVSDVVEVVRCKDCRYYIQDQLRCDHPQINWDIECYDCWVETNPDDFCSYGKMKKNRISKKE